MTNIEWPQLLAGAAMLTGAACAYLAGRRAQRLDAELDRAAVVLASNLAHPRNIRKGA